MPRTLTPPCPRSGEPVDPARWITQGGYGRYLCPCGAACFPTKDGRYAKHRTASARTRAETDRYLAPHLRGPDAVLVVADGEPMHQFTIDAIVDTDLDDRLIRARVIGVEGRAVTLRILDDD